MKIVQVLDALDYGDGVSNDVINKKNLLIKMGYPAEIYSRWYDNRVKHERKDIGSLRIGADDILIHHFSGKSTIIQDIIKMKCKKVFLYHNITPARFWNNKEETYEGLNQIRTYGPLYDFLCGDSSFNIKDLRKLGLQQSADVLPILINFARLAKKSVKSENSKTRILFVGRIAPNKCQDDIIRIFKYYYHNIDATSELYFVGNTELCPDYYQYLCRMVHQSGCSSNIFFTGKVTNEKLQKYYQSSSLFLCLSEHEGFCIPLIESMYYALPTIAYAASAVEETMGNAGILLYSKEPEIVSKLIYTIQTNNNLKENIIKQQNEWIKQFSEDKQKKMLKFLIEKWRK